MNAAILNLRTVILIAFLSAAGIVSLANGNGPIGGGSGAATAEVKYISSTGNQGLFNVVYNNTSGSRFSVEILDADGNQLYKHIFTEKKFDRNFQLADPENYRKLTFVIYNLGDRSIQRFEAAASTRLIEDVDVREIR